MRRVEQRTWYHFVTALVAPDTPYLWSLQTFRTLSRFGLEHSATLRKDV